MLPPRPSQEGRHGASPWRACWPANLLVLLDEPFAGLDRQLVRELIDDLVFWNRTLGFSMIAVDHQAEDLKRLCPEQAVVIEDGQAVQRGTWDELYGDPATPLLQSLLDPL
jgi:ABC-type sulfate/molybdate transport systems ATPase subunit